MKPSAPPSGVDYDTWVGPAEWMPFQANRFHYDWHWWYNFGCGDLGNDGIHEFDYALWGLGVEDASVADLGRRRQVLLRRRSAVPRHAAGHVRIPGRRQVGNRRMLIYEQRLWSTTYPYNVDSGAEYFGTKGRMFISKRGKFEIGGERNEPLDVKLDRKSACRPREFRELDRLHQIRRRAERQHRNRRPHGHGRPSGKHRHCASAARFTSIRRRKKSPATTKRTLSSNVDTAPMATGLFRPRCARSAPVSKFWNGDCISDILTDRSPEQIVAAVDRVFASIPDVFSPVCDTLAVEL